MLMVTQWIPFFNTPLATRLWQMSTAILAGACGNIILVYYLIGLMGPVDMIPVLDWIVGFNTALTGYMLVEKSGTDWRFRRSFTMGAGLINAGLTMLAINRLDMFLIHTADAAILLTVSAVCSVLGGMLARKYIELRNGSMTG